MSKDQRGSNVKTYGDLVKVKGLSIELSAKMLEPIGIFPNSRVSGIYLPSINDTDPFRSLHRHDLLFTSIHYKVWVQSQF